MILLHIVKELTGFLDSGIIIVLFILSVLLLVMIGITGVKLYHEIQKTNRFLTYKADDKAKPLPEPDEPETAGSEGYDPDENL